MSFLNQFKDLSKDSIRYGVGKALSRFIGIFTAPILTRAFLPEEFGIIALLQTLTGFLVMFAGFNINSGVFRYYYDNTDSINKKTILSTGLIFYLIFALIFSSLYWISAPIIENLLSFQKTKSELSIEHDYIKYIKILSISAFFQIISTNFSSVLRMTRQPLRYLLIDFVQIVGNLLFVIIMVLYLEKGIDGVLWGSVYTFIFSSIIGALITYKNYSLSFSFHYLKLFLLFCLPQFPAVIINFFLHSSNRFFLNYYSEAAHLGYFEISVKVGSIFLLFSTAFRMAWDPYALSIMNEKNSKSTYAKFYSVYFIIIGGLGLFIASISKPILMVLAPVNYHIAYSIIFLLIWANFLEGSNNILGIGISISKKTKYISFAQLIAFSIAIILNFILIPIYGAWGAAWAMLGAAFAQSLSYYYFAQKIYHIPYKFLKNNLFFIAAFIMVGLFNIIIAQMGIIMSTIYGIIFSIFIAIMVWFVLIEKDYKNFILNSLIKYPRKN